jgi:cbb3-type cytochrome oxidase subunit 3
MWINNQGNRPYGWALLLIFVFTGLVFWALKKEKEKQSFRYEKSQTPR